MVLEPRAKYPVSVRRRTRKPFDPIRRLEVAKTRAVGACTDCRRKKVRCFHARRDQSKPESPLLPTVSEPSSSSQLDNSVESTLPNRVVALDQSEVEPYGNAGGYTDAREYSASQLWDDRSMPLSDVSERSIGSSIAQQVPFDARTRADAGLPTSNTSVYKPMENTVEMSNSWDGLHITHTPSAGYTHWSQSVSQPPTYETRTVPVRDQFASQVGIYTQANGPWVTHDQTHHSNHLYGTLNSHPTFDSDLLHPDTSLAFAPDRCMLNSMSPLANSASTDSAFSPSSSASHEPSSSVLDNAGYNTWQFTEWAQ